MILTDQKSLTQLSDQRLHTHWQQRVFSKLLGLQYRIVYRPGTDNRVTDALSCLPLAVCATVSSLTLVWVNSVLASYCNDPFVTSLMSKLALDPVVVPKYSIQSGLLRYRSHIWIGQDPTLQKHLITQFHSSSWGGHSGVPITG